MTRISTGSRLKAYWSSYDIKLNPGVSDAAIQAFESEYRVSLPPDLRNYFLSINGMDANWTDDELIRFWALEEVKPLTEGAPEYSDPSYLPNAHSFFLFADYSIWAHAYSVRLSKDLSERNLIYIIGCDAPILLADSFSEFAGLYLTNKKLIFP